jgi:hypothetical protein
MFFCTDVSNLKGYSLAADIQITYARITDCANMLVFSPDNAQHKRSLRDLE